MTIEEQIRQYITDNFIFSDNGYQWSNDTSLIDEDIVDSTGVLELVMFIEETFNVFVENEEIARTNFDSVNKLAAYIRRKADAKNPGGDKLVPQPLGIVHH